MDVTSARLFVQNAHVGVCYLPLHKSVPAHVRRETDDN